MHFDRGIYVRRCNVPAIKSCARRCVPRKNSSLRLAGGFTIDRRTVAREKERVLSSSSSSPPPRRKKILFFQEKVDARAGFRAPCRGPFHSLRETCLGTEREFTKLAPTRLEGNGRERDFYSQLELRSAANFIARMTDRGPATNRHTFLWTNLYVGFKK